MGCENCPEDFAKPLASAGESLEWDSSREKSPSGFKSPSSHFICTRIFATLGDTFAFSPRRFRQVVVFGSTAPGTSGKPSPKAHAGQESNWIYTQAGKKWFPWFRLYGPEKAVFDKSFRLPDVELVK